MLKNNFIFFKKAVETQIPQNFVDPQFLNNEILFTEYDTNLKLSIILSDARVSISITKEKNKNNFLNFVKQTQNIKKNYKIKEIIFWENEKINDNSHNDFSKITEVTIESNLINVNSEQEITNSISSCLQIFTDLKILNGEDISQLEGKQYHKLIKSYERSSALRKCAIAIHGYICSVCEIDFFEKYGEIGLGFIHIHHLETVADSGQRMVNPETDLVPVCPNCHAMLHKKHPPIHPEKLKNMLEK